MTAAILPLASRAGSYASAFGRLSFAFEVPAALIGLPIALAGAILLLVGELVDAEPFALLSFVTSTVVFVWSMALTVFAVRASVVGVAAVGCTALLIAVAFIASVVALGALLIASDGVSSVLELPAD